MDTVELKGLLLLKRDNIKQICRFLLSVLIGTFLISLISMDIGEIERITGFNPDNNIIEATGPDDIREGFGEGKIYNAGQDISFDKVKIYGSWMDTDVSTGSMVTRWYGVKRPGSVTLAVFGTPNSMGGDALEKNELYVEIKSKDGNITKVNCNIGGHSIEAKLWEILLGSDVNKFRIIAVDNMTGPGGWVGFSEPIKKYYTIQTVLLIPILSALSSFPRYFPVCLIFAIVAYFIYKNLDLNKMADSKYKILLFVISVLLLIFRRPGQVLYPYIWNEDAKIILTAYQNSGFLSILEPVQGYYILISKIINFLAYKISFWYYPEIASFLMNTFCIAVIFAIAYSPTYLKFPGLCAVLVCFIKINAECFGTALYAFWWAGLLLILATLWRPENNISKKWRNLRVFYILLGGLSSPLIFIASPMLCVRAALIRNRSETTAAIVSLFPFLLQTHIFFTGNRSNGILSLIKPDLRTINAMISTYFGQYLVEDRMVRNNIFVFIIGLTLFCLLSFFAIKYLYTMIVHRSLDNECISYIMLFIWLCGVILMSTALISLSAVSPYFHSRYFFYPFIIISWLVVWIAQWLIKNKKKTIVLPIVLYFMVFSFLFDGSMGIMSLDHNKHSWRGELSNAINSDDEYVIPSHAGVGGLREYWGAEVTSEQCRKMIEDSLMFNNVSMNMANLDR